MIDETVGVIVSPITALRTRRRHRWGGRLTGVRSSTVAMEMAVVMGVRYVIRVRALGVEVMIERVVLVLV